MTGALRWSVLALALVACAKNVAQDSDSGKDARHKGARKIALEDGEGASRVDVVTYPGGDRSDWKVFEVPKGKAGTVRVRLRFKPPRPGLDLAFDVYDQYLHRVARARPTPGSGKRLKKATIKDAEPGKYYVHVYAPERGDAGTYRVRVDFKQEAEAVAEASADEKAESEAASEIPDPPTLPAIPEAAGAATAGAPPPGTTPPGGSAGAAGAGGGAAGGGAAAGAGAAGASDAGGTGVAAGAAGTGAAASETPATGQPVNARVSRYVVSGGGLVITVDKGKNAGVETGWKGQVLGGSGQPVRGGEFTVVKVTGGEAQGKVGLSVDQIKSNGKVRLSPP
jgi:hypothetical protein